MKNTCAKITFLLILTILLCSLSGCADLLNEEGAQLTIDALKSDTTYPEITLNKIVFLKPVSDDTTLIPYWNSISGSLYLLSLKSTGTNSYNYTKTRWDISYYSTNGYRCCEEDSLSDAYMLATKEYSSDEEYSGFSNIIKKEDVIIIDAKEPSTWSNSVILERSYCAYEHSYYPTSSSTTLNSSHPYLWVNLEGNIWICLGDVYNN